MFPKKMAAGRNVEHDCQTQNSSLVLALLHFESIRKADGKSDIGFRTLSASFLMSISSYVSTRQFSSRPLDRTSPYDVSLEINELLKFINYEREREKSRTESSSGSLSLRELLFN